MAKKVKDAASKAAEQDKVVTKYDRKMQRRKEEAERAKKEARKSKITGIVIVVLLVAFVLSFPIRSYMAVNSEYITINGEKVTQVEFDYNYALAKASYLSSYGSYLNMYGMDASTIDSQMYSTDMTFEEYFEQLAVDKLIDTKALKAAAEAEGFVYDTTQEYQATIADMKTKAEVEGITLKQYMKEVYGSLATESRLKSFIEETLYTVAFYNQKSEEKLPSLEEITAHYNENKDAYDSIKYRMSIVEAELPTTAPDGTVPKDAEGNDVAYEPTEKEVATAMASAKKKAQEACKTVATEGEEYTIINQRMSYYNSLIEEFLYDESRKSGDTYVAEDTANNRYLVVAFDERYRDETPTADVLMLLSTTTASQTILDEWKAGEGTKDSFVDMVLKYDESGSSANGGLVESLAVNYMPEEMSAWLTASERQKGDTFAMDVEGDGNYVLYYLEPGDAGWVIDIRKEILNNTMIEYLENLEKDYSVEDPKGHLEYLQIEADNVE